MMEHGLVLTMERDVERCGTVCTVFIPEGLQIERGPPPVNASMGDSWISLSAPEDAARLQALGYWDLEPEGLAMSFLRLAWYAGWAELHARHAPFDGDPARSWDKTGASKWGS